MRSAGYVVRGIAFGRVTRIVAVLAGIVATFSDASVAVINHVAFVCGDHHRVIVRGKGSDQHVHVVLHPPRQFVPDGLRCGGNGGVEVEVGEGVPEVAEDTGESALEQATTPFLHKLASSGRSSLQARHHLSEED